MKRGMIILICLVLISGCNVNTQNNDQEIYNNVLLSAYKNGVQECDYLSSEKLKARCIDEFNAKVDERNVKASYLKEAIESDDITRCDVLTDTNKEFCKEMYSAMLIFSKGKKGKEYCNIMNDPIAKTNCVDVYYMYKSVSSGDKSYCEEIRDIGIRKGCIEE